MSHDEPTLPERRQAEMLARWLDGATESIPEELDQDVVEAVIALRPELAPAPSLSAEDILAGVRTGPLAASPLSASEADAVPPAVAAPSPRPANSSRWMGWAAMGAGGLAAVAAAGLLFIATTTLNGPMAPGSVAQLEERATAPAAAPMEPAPEATRTVSAEPPALNEERNRQEEAAPPADEIRIIMGSTREENKVQDLFDDSLAAGANEAGSMDPSEDQRGAGGVGGLLGGSAGEADAGFGAAPDSGVSAPTTAEPSDDAVADLDAVDGVDEAEDLDAFDLAEEKEEPARETTATTRSASVELESDVVSESIRSGGRSQKRAANAAKDLEQSMDTASLERAARPTGPVAAEVEAIQGLISRGEAADARSSAQRLLDGGGLSDLRRADLYWVLGQAHQSLGARRKAESAYREAIRLRGR